MGSLILEDGHALELIHHLPSSSINLVGRQTELSEIVALLADPSCRLVTLLGPGGIGKTRLALEVAHLLAASDEQAHHFAEGVCMVLLQPLTSPEFAVYAIAETLDFQFHSSDDPTEQLLQYLRHKTMLLVMDNFEHLLEASALVSDILAAAPGVKILSTSRERLNLHEEWVYEVRGLAFPAGEAEADIENYSAVQLFVQSARRVQSGFVLLPSQYAAVWRICRMVGGSPLGIELAAAWVRVLPCDEIAAELERSLDILKTPIRNVPARHRTIRAAFEPTWERLSEEEQRVFKRLSIFRGGFSREGAQAVAQASLPVLSALIDKSLLQVNANGTYDIHELLRQYGEEKLNEVAAEMEQVQQHYCSYYAKFLRDRWHYLGGECAKEVFEEIDHELENIRVFWQLAIQRHAFSEIDAAADTLWLYYDTRSRYQEGERVFSQALTLVEQHGQHRKLQSKLMAGCGAFCTSLSRYERGKALLEASLVLLDRIDAPQDRALILLELGRTQTFLVGTLIPRHYFEESIAICRAIDDKLGLARALDWLACILCAEGRVIESKSICEEGIAICKEIGCQWGLAIGYKTMCSISLILKEYEAARQYALESLALYRDVGVPWGIALSLLLLAHAIAEIGDPEEAQRFAIQGLGISFELQLGDFYILEGLAVIAKLWFDQGMADRALELLAVFRTHTLTIEYPAYWELMNQLKASFSAEQFAAITERSKTIDIYATGKTVWEELSQTIKDTVSLPVPASNQALVDPLTEREFEILCLVAEGLSNREIAGRLFLSVGTVKWYVNQIYNKLQVGGRVQAIARAKELHLLA